MKNNSTSKFLVIIAVFLIFQISASAQSYATNESFEGQGWNAKDARGFTPGLKKSLNLSLRSINSKATIHLL